MTASQRAPAGPASDFAPEHVTFGRGHGRTEQRNTRLASVTAETAISFPHGDWVY